MPASAHQAAWFADAAAKECSADSEQPDAARPVQPVKKLRAEPEAWEHRPCQPEAAASVPIKSDLAVEEAPASTESPSLAVPQAPDSQVEDSPAQDSTEQPACVKQVSRAQPAEPLAAQAEEPPSAEPDAATESTAARTIVPSTKEAAMAARDARVLPELLRRSSLAASP